MKKTIVIVCRGNIVRSPFAEELVRRKLIEQHLEDKFEVVSRGVQGTSVDPDPVKHSNIRYYSSLNRHAEPLLERLNVNLSQHHSRAIDAATASSASIVLAMDREIQAKLIRLFPEHRRKFRLFSEIVGKDSDIGDPDATMRPVQQEHVLVEIADMVDRGFAHMLEMAGEQ